MENITVEEVKKRMDAGENLHLVDVREPSENAEFNIGGTLLPLGKIQSLQVDEIEDELNWKSVLAYGTYEEITNRRERAEALNHLLARFSRLTPVESFIAVDAGAPAPVVFRIHVNRITGICEGGAR